MVQWYKSTKEQNVLTSLSILNMATATSTPTRPTPISTTPYKVLQKDIEFTNTMQRERAGRIFPALSRICYDFYAIALVWRCSYSEILHRGHKSALCPVIAWCRTGNNHYLIRVWPRHLKLYDITKGQSVKSALHPITTAQPRNYQPGRNRATMYCIVCSIRQEISTDSLYIWLYQFYCFVYIYFCCI